MKAKFLLSVRAGLMINYLYCSSSKSFELLFKHIVSRVETIFGSLQLVVKMKSCWSFFYLDNLNRLFKVHVARGFRNTVNTRK